MWWVKLEPKVFLQFRPKLNKNCVYIRNYFHSSLFACELIDSQYIYQIVMLLLYIVIRYNLQYY